MKLTIANCIDRLNQILNFPALTYEEVSVFFDQAIEELNTSLNIGLKTVSELIYDTQKDITGLPNVVLLDSVPTDTTRVPTTLTEGYSYYFDATSGMFKIVDGDSSERSYKEIYGVYNNHNEVEPRIYKATVVSNNLVVWNNANLDDSLDLDLTNYVPISWIILFIIPYVCFKYSVRDGDSGRLYSEEFTQGFQQIQNSYNVPSKVLLAAVADQVAYRNDVLHHLPNLNVEVPTRAVTESMKTDHIIQAVYGGIYDNGGWNL